jgi:hypothetical protein
LSGSNGRLRKIINKPVAVRILESILNGLVEFFELNFNLNKIVPKFRNNKPYNIKKLLDSNLGVKNPVLSNKCKEKKRKRKIIIKISTEAILL